MTCRRIHAFVVALLILTIAACTGREAAHDGKEEVLLRTYAVPDGFDPEEFRTYLRQSFDRGEQTLGAVSLLPDGSLVVTAPAGIHAGIQDMLDQVADRGPRQIPAPKLVSVRYWALVARPAADESGRFGGVLAHAEGLQPVLRELMASQGPLEFEQIDQIQLTSADTNASFGGRSMRVNQRLLPRTGSLIMLATSISLSGTAPHSIDTIVRLEPGKHIVLGQAGYAGPLPSGWQNDGTAQLYYVMSAEAD